MSTTTTADDHWSENILETKKIPNKNQFTVHIKYSTIHIKYFTVHLKYSTILIKYLWIHIKYSTRLLKQSLIKITQRLKLWHYKNLSSGQPKLVTQVQNPSSGQSLLWFYPHIMYFVLVCFTFVRSNCEYINVKMFNLSTDPASAWLGFQKRSRTKNLGGSQSDKDGNHMVQLDPEKASTPSPQSTIYCT